MNGFDFLLDFEQRYKDSEAQDIAYKAEAKVNRVNNDIEQINRRMDKITLVCQALCEQLKDHADLTNEQILDKIEEIDLRDGVIDKKIGARVIKCPNCGRNSNTKNDNCLYCGTRLKKQHVIE